MKAKTLKSESKQKLIFYLSIVILPLIQFSIFYIYVNFNSFLLSFKSYSYEGGKMVGTWVGLENLGKAFSDLFNGQIFLYCLKNSLIMYGVTLCAGIFLALLFSYYIFKKRFASNFFKAMLYMPAIVSPMVLAVIFKYLYDLGIPNLVLKISGKDITGYSSEFTTQYLLILFYNFLMSFGGNVLIYTGTMASISPSTIEASEIDGVNTLQEFWYVILPSMFSTFTLFLVTSLVNIFNGQFNLFNFFGLNADPEYYTYGYYLYVKTQQAEGSLIYYPQISAIGLALTFIAIPIILGLRAILTKYGPSEE